MLETLEAPAVEETAKCEVCSVGVGTCGVPGIVATVTDGKIVGEVYRCDCCKEYGSDAEAKAMLEKLLKPSETLELSRQICLIGSVLQKFTDQSVDSAHDCSAGRYSKPRIVISFTDFERLFKGQAVTKRGLTDGYIYEAMIDGVQIAAVVLVQNKNNEITL
jgi:hypothetical protein